MQFASFDFADPVFEAFGFRFSLQLHTLENGYGLDAARCTRSASQGEVVIRTSGLACAGQQERAEGEAELRVRRMADGSLRASLRARAAQPLRSAKLILRDLPLPLAVVRDDGSATPVGPWGELLAYPTTLSAPFVCARSGERTLGLRFEDAEVRAKRFALATERMGPFAGLGALEAIHEEDATRFARELVMPELVICEGASPASLAAAHCSFAERALGLRAFEQRTDVPPWAQRLRLVATLHGMHWSGRVFLRYDEMLGILRFIAERVGGEGVLAYLPGWEGRYYWQYGDYRPEPALGGEGGFAALCDGARALGIHVMPMFGANCANVWLPQMQGVPDAAYLKSATRNRFHGNQPDWDLSRAHDTGWQAWLNPGHPWWRELLGEQIASLAQRFGFDAVFLDTLHAWTNDPNHAVLPGIAQLARDLHARIPQLLLAGEADYDALHAHIPLFQRPWWTTPPAWTARYVRRFGHLCEGEPRGRTGVHEFGVWQPSAPPKADEGFIATLAFQDGTLAEARDEIERRLAEIPQA